MNEPPTRTPSKNLATAGFTTSGFSNMGACPVPGTTTVSAPRAQSGKYTTEYGINKFMEEFSILRVDLPGDAKETIRLAGPAIYIVTRADQGVEFSVGADEQRATVKEGEVIFVKPDNDLTIAGVRGGGHVEVFGAYCEV